MHNLVVSAPEAGVVFVSVQVQELLFSRRGCLLSPFPMAMMAMRCRKSLGFDSTLAQKATEVCSRTTVPR